MIIGARITERSVYLMEMTRLPLRFSEAMLRRLNAACEREGIDRSSLVVSHMYQVVQGGVTEFDLSFYTLDHGREKTIDIRVSKRLKEGFEQKIQELNKNRTEGKLTTSNILISHLIRFIVSSEKA